MRRSAGNKTCSSTAIVSSAILTLLAACKHASCLESTQQIKEMGYPLETHSFLTIDKYKLGVERIPYSKHGQGNIGKPVMLIHGLYLSSAIFVLNNSSLGFVLSDAGYDVWLFNCRGTGLSRTLSIYDKPGSLPKMNRISWDFSFHEMGIYDMPAAINFILKNTEYSKLDVVGYSLGTTVALVSLTDRPEYNSKINKLVLMAPTSRLKSAGAPINIFKLFPEVSKFFLGIFKFLPYTEDPDTTYKLIKRICTNNNIFMYCKSFLDLAQGITLPLQKDTVLNMISEFPQPMSTKTLSHFLQFLVHGRFCHYDYGPTENMLRYNRTTPPDYDLSRVTAPVFIFYSKYDTLVPPRDVNWLISKLPNVKNVTYIDKIPFGHLSFSTSPIMKEVINLQIANTLLDDKK